MDMISLYAIPILVALLIFFFLYDIFIHTNTTSAHHISSTIIGHNDRIETFLSQLSDDIHMYLPEGMGGSSKAHDDVERLLTHAGNPWHLDVGQFLLLRWILFGVGAGVGAVVAWVTAGQMLSLPWWVLAPLFAIVGYMIPPLSYRAKAKERDFLFTSEMPDALQLILSSLSGGKILGDAIRSSVGVMRDSPLKDEFSAVINDVNVGSSFDDALAGFEMRAPNDSVKSFVSALRAAERSGTSATSLLKAQAEMCQKDHVATIRNKVSQLESKMAIILAALTAPATLCVCVAPTIHVLASSL